MQNPQRSKMIREGRIIPAIGGYPYNRNRLDARQLWDRGFTVAAKRQEFFATKQHLELQD
jgi:hypothetical protein